MPDFSKKKLILNERQLGTTSSNTTAVSKDKYKSKRELDELADKKELSETGQIKNPRSTYYKNAANRLKTNNTNLSQNKTSNEDRISAEEKGNSKEFKKNVKENILKPIKVAADVAQLGNFIPNPLAQTVGKIGSGVGFSIDAYQAYDDIKEGDYSGAAMNMTNMVLPAALSSQAFKRSSKFLKPGDALYSTTPQASGKIFGKGSRTTYIDPINQTKGMSSGNLMANRGLLGALGTETSLDLNDLNSNQKAYGGNLTNNNMNNKNDLTHINEGGSHEQNPLGGVPMGGNNTVEQGETIQNDFVFSDRMKLNEDVVKQFNLPKSLIGKTIAEATKVIDSKFKDRSDKISMSTKDSMLAKIGQAQEMMKPQEPEPMIDPVMQDQTMVDPIMDQNQMFLGGDLDGEVDYTQSATAGIGALGSLAMGDKQGALTGVLSAGLGAAGTMFGGPIGGMIGGQLGTIAGGLIGSAGEKKKLRNESINNHRIASNRNTNDFANGGPLDGYRTTPEEFNKYLNDNRQFATSLNANTNSIINSQNALGVTADGKFGKNSIAALKAFQTSKGLSPDGILGSKTYGEMGLRPNGSQFDSSPVGRSAGRTDTTTPTSSIPIQPGYVPNDVSANNSSNIFNKENLNKAGDVLGQAARYAPIAMNAYQLSKLKKPAYESLNRLDQKFKPEYVDERQLQNIAGSELNNVSNSLTSATNGSTGALRNSLLAASLNRGKSLSDAYGNASAQNRAMNIQGQQFDANVNQVNLQQGNLENDINARNMGNYDTQKSKLLSELGNNIGGVGKEEVFKKIAKTTTGYNWLGKYMKENPKATEAEAVAAYQKETGQKKLGGYLMKNKK